jgi:hypothetical protein
MDDDHENGNGNGDDNGGRKPQKVQQKDQDD